MQQHFKFTYLVHLSGRYLSDCDLSLLWRNPYKTSLPCSHGWQNQRSVRRCAKRICSDAVRLVRVYKLLFCAFSGCRFFFRPTDLLDFHEFFGVIASAAGNHGMSVGDSRSRAVGI